MSKQLSLSNQELLNAFESDLLQKRSRGTARKYVPVVSAFLADIGEAPPGDLSLGDLHDYFDRWYRGFQATYGRPPAADTYRAQFTALKKFFRFLESRERLRDHAGADVPNRMAAIEPPPRSHKAIDYLNPDERDALLGFRGEPHEEIIIWLLLEAGLRVGELVALTIGDVDLRTPGEETLRVRKSKTPTGKRTIPLTYGLVLELTDWFQHLKATGRYGPNQPVLSTRTGGPVHTSWVWRVVKRVAAKAGVRPTPCACGTKTVWGHAHLCPRNVNGENRSKVTSHTLRRTFATNLLNEGMPMEGVSKLLGHTNVAITAEAYAELGDKRVLADFRRAKGYLRAA
jgi:integrase